MGLDSGMVITKRATMAHCETGDQFVQMTRCIQTQRAVVSGATTTEIRNRTEMGIGMVVTTDHLPPLAEYRPTALEVQIHLSAIESSALEIVPNPSHNLVS